MVATVRASPATRSTTTSGLCTSRGQTFGRISRGGVLSAAHLARMSSRSLGFPSSSSVWREAMASSRSSGSQRTSSACIESASTCTGSTPAWACPGRLDHRDVPNLYRESGFPMDEAKLRARLKSARLILGDVNETIGTFLASRPAPVGFVSVDVDLYSSTMSALKVVRRGPGVAVTACVLLLRRHSGRDVFRVHRRTTRHCGLQRGPRDAERFRRYSVYGISCIPPHSTEAWPDQMFIAHLFDHDASGRYTGTLTGCRWLDRPATGRLNTTT